MGKILTSANKKDKIFPPIKGRVIQFIESQGIKKEEFYKKVDLKPSNFKGVGRRSELGGNAIVNILTSYPEIRTDWLILGRGEMIRQQFDFEALLLVNEPKPSYPSKYDELLNRLIGLVNEFVNKK